MLWYPSEQLEREWCNACSSSGVNDYPYGNTFTDSTCQASGSSSPVATSVLSVSSVQGYRGVYDPSGMQG